ncbi:general transcription factor IIE subunit 1 [Drosophila guanche]|uniref:General transcription factor IIE subunit 1 n=1 Tax=Drosophila guanche TaxID=7266 RepID=A0A3B0J506_DROGU|nr:general transcription factor IIE subunit 1 [Drosophila guanche]XP_034122222.1 general transcription factor IIE subunit 1 [Drosophila guanche]SPP76777.1 blast:General transcription factor IIE subunit 1 [Drosophila guanche]
MSSTSAAASNAAPAKEVRYVTEVPSSLKQLARLVVRGFYSLEDALIIDMLVRNPCMKEDDIGELLRFEKKQLRARITTLRTDKFIQIRLKMETGPDGKAQKVNYYFINYKTFVNVVKYKLDLMRKRMETEERDATSRASFKCSMCSKTFTDLEADQLFDMATLEFRCTYCGSSVEEDSAAMPKKDSRLMLAHFNEQLQPLYDLLREVEGIKLAPEVLEPEPVDIDTIRGITKPNALRPEGMAWSGEATRNQGFAVEEARVDVTIGGDDTSDNVVERKSRPIWMTESTVITDADAAEGALQDVAQTSSTSGHRNRKENEDIMSVLLQHEKQPGQKEPHMKGIRVNSSNANSSDSSDDEKDIDNAKIPDLDFENYSNSESEEEADDVPTVLVAGRPHPLDQLDDKLIAQMTPQEKENYIHVYQQHYSHIYD